MEKAATRQKNGITGGRTSALKMIILSKYCFYSLTEN